MPTINASNFPTQIDVAKTYGPGGEKVLPFITALSQSNIQNYVTPFIPGNQPNGHLVNVETYAPLPSTVQHGQGVNPLFGRSAQSFDTFCMIQDVFEVPVTTAEMFGNPNKFRYEQVLGRIRAMGRKYAQLYLYGNLSTNPLDINGLAVRYNHTSTTNSATAVNVVSAGGTTSNAQTSIWLVGNSPEGLTGIYPNRPNAGGGPVAGFYHVDEGIDTLPNAADGSGGTSGRLRIYRDFFQFIGGISLVDWRHVMRIPNCDTVDLATTNPQTDLKFFMQEAMARILFETNVPPEPGVTYAQPVFWWYFNRFIKAALGHNLLDTQIAGAGMREDNVRDPNRAYMNGWSYGGFPAGIADTILNTEAVVGS